MTRQTGRKKSNFPAQTSVLSGASMDYFANGVNYKISFSDFVNELGVSGTISSLGNGTPILTGTPPAYEIREIEAGSGIGVQTSPNDGILVSHNLTQDVTGEPVLFQPTAASPTIRSIVGGNNITVTSNSGAITVASDQQDFDSIVVVKSAADLSGTLDSGKLYLIDGAIDMGTTPIVVPAGGLDLRGNSLNVSSLFSTENSYTLFTSPVGGSGDLVMEGLAISVSGTGSKVYDLVGDTGNEALEINVCNFNNCSSLGSIESYRQGLESGTGRFGGQPSLEMVGNWSGGYRITTSIVRGIDNAMTAPLFKAGVGFLMNSRFLTDINCDLGTTAAFADFAPSNFAGNSLFQINGAIFTRNGTADATDATIIPNISSGDTKAFFKGNIGITNTYVGGVVTVTSEAVTSIAAASTFYDVAGTFTASDLQHFDNPTNGQLRNLTGNPREFNIVSDILVLGTATEDITIKFVKYDASAASFIDIGSQTREINNAIGGNDIAIFTSFFAVTLDENDYVKIQVANETSINNVTIQNSSFIRVTER